MPDYVFFSPMENYVNTKEKVPNYPRENSLAVFPALWAHKKKMLQNHLKEPDLVWDALHFHLWYIMLPVNETVLQCSSVIKQLSYSFPSVASLYWWVRCCLHVQFKRLLVLFRVKNSGRNRLSHYACYSHSALHLQNHLSLNGSILPTCLERRPASLASF